MVFIRLVSTYTKVLVKKCDFYIKLWFAKLMSL